MKPKQVLTSIKGVFIFAILSIILNSCGKEYSIETSSKPTAEGTWEFYEANNFFQGNIDSFYIIKGNSINELHLIGHEITSRDLFHLILYADTFKTGAYLASAFQSAFDYGNHAPYLYSADQTFGEFTVEVTSISENQIAGNFSGKAQKGGNDLVDITKGVFKATLNPYPEASPSEGTLGNESGNCTQMMVNGDYRAGSILNEFNTIGVMVNVNTPGSYQIYTDPVNGVVFSASGIFTKRGPQTITLTGSGTPLFGGEQIFTVHYGSSMCSFTIAFANAAAPSNDYFPLTVETDWIYFNDPFIYKVTSASTMFNGNKYTIIGKFNNYTDINYDTAFRVRKDAGNYYGVIDYSRYTGESTPQFIETIFLKDNIPSGASWYGPDFIQNNNGNPQTLHIKYTIIEKAVSVVLTKYSLPDVIKVEAEIYSGDTPTGNKGVYWYGKNIGPVYYKDINGTGFEVDDYDIR